MSSPMRPVSNTGIAPTSVPLIANEGGSSPVSWRAVFSGAFVAAAIATVLMTLGAGMGLSSMSPWPTAGASARPIALGAVVWIILVQVLACALGGYLAGRLRTKWVAVHDHEVYFRDTAHGLLVWAVSLVLGVAFLSTLATSIAKDLAGSPHEGTSNPVDYYADSLFRSPSPTADVVTPSLRAESGAILTKALAEPEIAAGDRAYLAALVAARTGLSEADAARRVDQVVASERQAADQARKAIAHSLYWLVVALLAGAFSGSYSAIFGGRRRDYVWPQTATVK
jgi:hypothetical protein